MSLFDLFFFSLKGSVDSLVLIESVIEEEGELRDFAEVDLLRKRAPHISFAAV